MTGSVSPPAREDGSGVAGILAAAPPVAALASAWRRLLDRVAIGLQRFDDSLWDGGDLDGGDLDGGDLDGGDLNGSRR